MCDKSVCNNYKDMKLLSMSGKLYDRVLIEEVKMYIKNVILDVQGKFRDRSGCVNKVFRFKNVYAKFLKKSKLYTWHL